MAGALARAELPVTLLMRPQTREQYGGRLRVESAVLGNFEVPVAARTELQEPVDALWVAPKTYGLEASLALAPTGRVGDALVVPLLNGVEHMEVLRRHYPSEQVVAGAIRVETERVGHGRVLQRSPFVIVSLVAAGATAGRVRALAAELASTGITTNVGDDEPTLLWGKLALLAPIALATGAVAGTMSAVRADAEVAGLLQECFRETAAVAVAEGAQLEPDAASKLAGALSGDFGTSMQRDVSAGNPLELDALAGPVVRAGHRHGIPTPATEQLIERVKARV
jgi:2-dehydropantoate 2-reductase